MIAALLVLPLVDIHSIDRIKYCCSLMLMLSFTVRHQESALRPWSTCYILSYRISVTVLVKLICWRAAATLIIRERLHSYRKDTCTSWPRSAPRTKLRNRKTQWCGFHALHLLPMQPQGTNDTASMSTSRQSRLRCRKVTMWIGVLCRRSDPAL